jgi:hypothetical protein
MRKKHMLGDTMATVEDLPQAVQEARDALRDLWFYVRDHKPYDHHLGRLVQGAYWKCADGLDVACEALSLERTWLLGTDPQPDSGGTDKPPKPQ